GNYSEPQSAADVEEILAARAADVPLAIAIEMLVETAGMETEEDEPEENLLPLQEQQAALAGNGPFGSRSGQAHAKPKIAIAVQAGSAITISPETDARTVLARALADEKIPKSVHDWKSAAHALGEDEVKKVQHDTRLYSYLLDPTYSSHNLPDLALRHFN